MFAPVQSIHSDIPIPTTPSNHIIPTKLRNDATRLNDVTIQSFIWSFALASNKILSCFFASEWVYIYKHNFVAIVAIHTITSHHENIYFSGFSSALIEPSNSFNDISIIDILTNIEKMYSAFPCPKLWSSSLGLLAILFPMNVINDEKISPALFTPSAIIAWLFVKIPTIVFIVSKNMLPIIPKKLAFWVDLNLSIFHHPYLNNFLS